MLRLAYLGEDMNRIIIKSIMYINLASLLQVLDAAKKLRLDYLEEDKDSIISKSIMDINLNSF
jgi:hypothetical protein